MPPAQDLNVGARLFAPAIAGIKKSAFLTRTVGDMKSGTVAGPRQEEVMPWPLEQRSSSKLRIFMDV
jgi:hypothetical protein